MDAEHKIRRAARYLQSLMHELHEHKHMRGKPVGEVVSGGAGFGPRAPGNGEAISLYCEIERELSIWLRDWKCERHRADQQLAWVAFNAEWVSQQPDSDGLLAELNRWAGQVERAVGRGPTLKDLLSTHGTRDENGEIWLTARTICYKMRQEGYSLKPELLRKWAERGQLTSRQGKQTRRLYNLQEVKDRLSAKAGYSRGA